MWQCAAAGMTRAWHACRQGGCCLLRTMQQHGGPLRVGAVSSSKEGLHNQHLSGAHCQRAALDHAGTSARQAGCSKKDVASSRPATAGMQGADTCSVVKHQALPASGAARYAGRISRLQKAGAACRKQRMAQHLIRWTLPPRDGFQHAAICTQCMIALSRVAGSTLCWLSSSPSSPKGKVKFALAGTRTQRVQQSVLSELPAGDGNQAKPQVLRPERPASLEWAASPGRYPARSPFTRNLTPQALQRMCFSGGPLRQQGVWKVPQWLQDSGGKCWLPRSQVTGRRHLLTCHQQDLAGIRPSIHRGQTSCILDQAGGGAIRDTDWQAIRIVRAKEAARGAAAAC